MVSDYPSVEACLKAMEEEGYQPVRRNEKPVFQEIKGKKEPEISHQEIVFEAIKIEE
ncbi:NETI motif-containing protein [Halalkalibacillus halophilus]|uniref:NETI motif-containing protein n=1 Tax=Halalkalibacillus halophilus TaxID=392827 RepID=UPI0003F606D0|nr:NETI motif-containing protein [Halalkalibacillus halophilus]